MENLKKLLKAFRSSNADIISCGNWKCTIDSGNKLYRFYDVNISQYYPSFMIDDKNLTIELSEYCAVVPVVEVLNTLSRSYKFVGDTYDRNVRDYIVLVKADCNASMYLGIIKAVSKSDALNKVMYKYPMYAKESLEIVEIE